jgi:hypothetical protein
MRNMLNRALRLGMTLAIVLLSANALAGTPDWLREAAKAPLAKYPEDTDAVVLLQERLVTVSPDGRVRSTYRKGVQSSPTLRTQQGHAVCLFR